MHPRFTHQAGPANPRSHFCFYSAIDGLVAISPHLDDVVLGCAGLVAAHSGAVVVTVTAGRPGAHKLTDWDRQCGFAQDDDVVGARRAEDRNALAHLGATPRWLDFLDRQYAGGRSPGIEEMDTALSKLLTGAAAVASPLGLGHPDHIAVAAACFRIAWRPGAPRWLVYEDAIYRSTAGGVDETLARLRDDGFVLGEEEVQPAADKRAAVEAYISQIRGLGDLIADAFRPERYWTVTPR